MGLFVRKQNTGLERPLYSIGAHKSLLIVGLGNPGKEYRLTRHNIGFECLEHFAQQNDFPKWATKKDLKAEITMTNLGETRVILAKPTTFMNNSGQAIQALQNFYKLDDSQTIIVHDEIDIPFGQIRLRQGGGHAGHNGVKSAITHGSANSGRVRIGIANDFSTQADSADFVLGKFTKAEQERLNALEREVTSLLTEVIYGGGQLPTETRSFIQ